MRKIIGWSLSFILGAVFIFSGYTKLYPIEPFEYKFVDLGIAGWQASVFIARIFIGFELACGILLLFSLWLRRFTIPVVIFTLVLFTGYLVFVILSDGNKGSCGCFGSYLDMSPLEGILKNIVLLAMAIVVYRVHPGFTFKGMKAVAGVLMAFSLSLPFILNPVDLDSSSHIYEEKANYKLDLDIIYESKFAPRDVELRKGKWIISFLSLSCSHCRIAAQKLQIIKSRNPDLDIHMVLNGDSAKLKPFFEETKTENLSWSVFNGGKDFLKLAGYALPQIFWVENSMVIRKSEYYTLQQQEIEQWQGKN